MSLITVQILFALPYSALNRDDTGNPKNYFQGGVMRGQLSSQSLKYAARKNTEIALLNPKVGSLRTGETPLYVLQRVRELNPEAYPTDAKDVKKLLKTITDALKTLISSKAPVETPKEDKDENGVKIVAKDQPKDEGNKQFSLYLSFEELESIAVSFAQNGGCNPTDHIAGHCTGALCIAAFGRMFANAPGFSTEAAIAVSDAVCVHDSNIFVDYFITGSDSFEGSKPSSGATFLSESAHTTGVYLRSFTIDTEQLRKSWTAFDLPEAPEMVRILVDNLIMSLPSGKSNSTAPYTPPLMVLAEKQRRRQSYHFETPVQHAEAGGYSQPAVDGIAKQALQQRAFDPTQVLEAVVAGTADVSNVPGEQMNYTGLVDQVTEWIFA